MTQHDPRIDAYISAQADFARPILEHLRELVHEACPNVEETIKWGTPTFVHAGGILCSMAAFKRHASFGFWKHSLVMEDDQSRKGVPGEAVPRDGMGSYGKLETIDDLPPSTRVLAQIRRAVQLNEAGIKASGARKSRLPMPGHEVPADLAAALSLSAPAKATFDALSPGQKREYIDWITHAKREETRGKRLAQAIEWMAEGKRRNWKYENC